MRWADWPALRPGERSQPEISEREAVLLALVRAGVLNVRDGRVVGDSEWPWRVAWVPVHHAQRERPHRQRRPVSRIRLGLGLLILAMRVLWRGER